MTEFKVIPGAEVEDGAILGKYIEPTIYENADGPMIGVTTAGVIQTEEGQYFKDSNNNGQLDPFEDWRLPVEERIQDVIKRLTNEQKAAFLLNHLMGSPQTKKTSEIYNEDGTVNMELVWPSEESIFGKFDYAEGIKNNLRASVLRGENEPEVVALFNNVMSQVSEYDSVNKGEVALPYTMLSNPLNEATDANTKLSSAASKNYATYPSSLGLAAAVMGTADYALVEHYADTSRREWNAQGIDMMYGPQIDVVTDPRWPRNNGTYGEIPGVVSGIAKALVTGYQQGSDGVKPGSVGLTIKHFPGDGASENGFESHSRSGQWRLYPTPGSLEKYHLPPFKTTFENKVASVMTAYSRPTMDKRSVEQTYQGKVIPSDTVANAYNHGISTELLREMMGFEGYVNSDSGVIPPIEGTNKERESNPFTSIKNYGVEELNTSQAMALMIKAGSDVMGGDFLPEEILKALDAGDLTQADLDLAVSRRLQATFEMGRFENPYVDPAVAKSVSDETTADPTIYKAHQQAVVLMKNSDGVLPLKDKVAKVYVEYFDGVKRVKDGEQSESTMDKIMGGKPKETEEEVTARLAEEFGRRGFQIVKTLEEADFAYMMVEPAVLSIDNANYLQVLELGENIEVEERQLPFDQARTGETVSVTNVNNFARIHEVADLVHENGGKVIIALNNTSPWLLDNIEPYADGLIGLYGSYFDTQLDVLTGVALPTGKLPITFPSSAEAIRLNEVEIDGETYEVSVSPNDVPGFDKDKYIDQAVLDTLPNGSYIYKDTNGNDYVAGFGLTY